VLEGGRIRVPDGPGIGVRPNADTLRRFAVEREHLRA
jgi:L-alanine-DL-glutamate epimerase-like enolase superfamily enzyme